MRTALRVLSLAFALTIIGWVVYRAQFPAPRRGVLFLGPEVSAFQPSPEIPDAQSSASPPSADVPPATPTAERVRDPDDWNLELPPPEPPRPRYMGSTKSSVVFRGPDITPLWNMTIVETPAPAPRHHRRRR